MTFVPAAPDLALPRVVAALQRIARLAGAIPIGIGALVLLGWAAGLETLKRVIPGLVAMNPATAIAFICLGLGVRQLAAAFESGGKPPHSKAFAIIVLLIAALKLLAIVSPLDFHVDQLLFHDRLAAADGGLPNRMAPNTALNFLLLGTALLVIDRRVGRIHFPSQYLALITAMISLLALMGYAYGVHFFYGIGSYIPMALHTALTFFITAVGILCARPDQGIMTVIASDSSGGALVRRLLPAILLLPALLGCLRFAVPDARFFDSRFGIWLLIVGIMTVLAALVGWNGRLLFRSDIDRVLSEQTLAWHAMHDALTGLPNRLLFIEQLTAALKQGAAVLFIDLDRFKVINDSLGHPIGDELLIAAGKRISDTLDGGQIAARIGGDEFTVLLPDATPEVATEVARKIESSFESPFALGPHQVFTTVSIGIAVSAEGEAPLDVIRHADIAMYHAKSRGRARYVTFHPSMDAAAQKRLELESGLRRAIANNELRVYYQPEVEIESGRIAGMEALVRWQSPDRGLVPPSEFIAVAEESGLILPIGRWVLFEACRQAKEWEDRYQIPLAVSVNLSGRHFQQATLIDEVSEVIAKTGINPAHLILEITETVAMEGADTTIEVLRKLKALGVSLAIDDFGTGFSSLAYLKRFPVDYLKIDKSFVDGVAEDGHDTAIVQAVIALGHALGLKMIAEGIESSEQVEQLRVLGSEIGQGYYFGTPLTGGPTGGMAALLGSTPPWKKQRD